MEYYFISSGYVCSVDSLLHLSGDFRMRIFIPTQDPLFHVTSDHLNPLLYRTRLHSDRVISPVVENSSIQSCPLSVAKKFGLAKQTRVITLVFQDTLHISTRGKGILPGSVVLSCDYAVLCVQKTSAHFRQLSTSMSMNKKKKNALDGEPCMILFMLPLKRRHLKQLDRPVSYRCSTPLSCV